jgi:hypothetical protein
LSQEGIDPFIGGIWLKRFAKKNNVDTLDKKFRSEFATEIAGDFEAALFNISQKLTPGELQMIEKAAKELEEISKDLIKGVNTLINSNIPHFPMHYIILGTFYKYIQNVESLRFIFLQIYILIPIFFYKCLLEISIKKEKALLLSTIIFVSPYFRSSAIWSTTDNTALLFFLISVFFFLKINKLRNDYKYLYTFLSIIFLSLSALTRFYYITFILYFIFELIKKNDFKYILINGIFSLIIFFPSVAYYFITKKLLHNFMTDNIFNNIFVIKIIFLIVIHLIF